MQQRFQAHIEHIFGHSCSHAIASHHAEDLKKFKEAIAQTLEQKGYTDAAKVVREIEP